MALEVEAGQSCSTEPLNLWDPTLSPGGCQNGVVYLENIPDGALIMRQSLARGGWRRYKEFCLEDFLTGLRDLDPIPLAQEPCSRPAVASRRALVCSSAVGPHVTSA